MNNLTWSENTIANQAAAEKKELQETEKLSVEKIIGHIDHLIADTKHMVNVHNKVYEQFANTDLGCIIGRLENNITQLKKIKDSLID